MEEPGRLPRLFRLREDRMTRLKNLFSFYGPPALLYTLVVLVMTWPLVLKFRTHTWGIQWDLWGNLWLYWYVKNCIVTGQSLYFTPNVFYPHGTDLAAAFGHYFLALLSVPLQLVFPLVVVNNILIIGNLVFTAMAVYTLVHHVCRERWSALVAGALFLFTPYIYGELSVGSLENLSVGWFVLGVYYLLRVFEERDLFLVWRCAALLALNALFSWVYGIMLMAFAVVFLAFTLLGADPSARGGHLARAVAIVAVFGALVLPFVAPVALSANALAGLHLDPGLIQADSWSDYVVRQKTVMDLTPRDILLYEAFAPVDNSFDIANFTKSFPVFSVVTNAPGMLLCFLGLAGACTPSRPRYRMLWGTVTFLFFLFCFGPYLRYNYYLIFADGMNPVPMPYLVFYNVFRVLRYVRPYRYVVLVCLGLVMLAAPFLARTFAGISSPVKRRALAAFLILAGMVELLCLYPRAFHKCLTEVDSPSFYHELAQDPSRYGILDIPCYPFPLNNANARAQYYQTIHNKPVFASSHYVRYSNLFRLKELAEKNTFLHAVLQLQYDHRQQNVRIRMRDLEDFVTRNNFRYIVLHGSYEEDLDACGSLAGSVQRFSEPLVGMFEALFGPPEWHGDRLVFRCDRPAPLSVDGEGFIVGLEGVQFQDVLYGEEKTEIRLLPRVFANRHVIPVQVTIPDPQAVSLWVRGDGNSDEDGNSVRLVLAQDGPRGKEHFQMPLPVSSSRWRYCNFRFQDFRPLVDKTLTGTRSTAEAAGSRLDPRRISEVSLYQASPGLPRHLFLDKVQIRN